MVECDNCVFVIRSPRKCYLKKSIKDDKCKYYGPLGGRVDEDDLRSQGLWISGVVGSPQD